MTLPTPPPDFHMPPPDLSPERRDRLISKQVRSLWEWARAVGRVCVDTHYLKSFAQISHGFSVGDPVYYSTTTHWTLAQADAAGTIAAGVVAAVPSDDLFVLQAAGFLTRLAHGLTVGDEYFLSSTVAGEFQTARAGGGDMIQHVFFVVDDDTILLGVGGGEVSS